MQALTLEPFSVIVGFEILQEQERVRMNRIVGVWRLSSGSGLGFLDHNLRAGP